jgi:hypothetical protein
MPAGSRRSVSAPISFGEEEISETQFRSAAILGGSDAGSNRIGVGAGWKPALRN